MDFDPLGKQYKRMFMEEEAHRSYSMPVEMSCWRRTKSVTWMTTPSLVPKKKNDETIGDMRRTSVMNEPKYVQHSEKWEVQHMFNVPYVNTANAGADLTLIAELAKWTSMVPWPYEKMLFDPTAAPPEWMLAEGGLSNGLA